MAQNLVFDNDKISIWCTPGKKLIHHKIKKYLSGQGLKDALLAGTDNLVKYKATKWLSDDRNNGALSQEDAQWAQTVWFPKTKENGWKYWAVVLPEKVVGQLNMTRFVKTYSDLGITAKVFSDSEDALKWLEQFN